MNEELDFLERQPQLKGVVLTSAKRSVFIAGADLNILSGEAPGDAARELIELGQAVMNRLAALAVPSVAAIHGAAVGGGCELCLACDYRIASSDRATKLGLPETQLGLLPAWGGSTRLPRLIGLPKALDIILGGKTLPAAQALKHALVDDVVPAQQVQSHTGVSKAFKISGWSQPCAGPVSYAMFYCYLPTMLGRDQSCTSLRIWSFARP